MMDREYLDEEIASIKWCIEDIKLLFQDNGIAFTEENVDKFLDQRLTKTLEEGSISYGWEIMNNILCQCKHELEKIDEE